MEEGVEMANLLTCEQLNEDRCPCQSVVSLSLGGVYMSVSEDDVNPESLSISSLLSLFDRSVILWQWQRWWGLARMEGVGQRALITQSPFLT